MPNIIDILLKRYAAAATGLGVVWASIQLIVAAAAVSYHPYNQKVDYIWEYEMISR